MKVNVWGVKNLKKVTKKDPLTGEETTEKRCTGVIEFPVGAIEAGVFEDQDCEIELSDNKEKSLGDIFKDLDVLASGFLSLAGKVQEIDVKRNEAISEVTPMPEEE